MIGEGAGPEQETAGDSHMAETTARRRQGRMRLCVLSDCALPVLVRPLQSCGAHRGSEWRPG